MHIGIEIKKAYSDFQGLKLCLMLSFIFASVIFLRISKTFHVCVSIDFTNMLRDFGWEILASRRFSCFVFEIQSKLIRITVIFLC